MIESLKKGLEGRGGHQRIPALELLDRRRVMSYWVRVIPTPRQAAVLLEECGGLPEEERGKPYKQ